VILSFDDLARYRGRGVVLLDGAFDPLHAGHLAYLSTAATAFPNHLRVIAIASDDDIRAKGREPFFDQLTRATIVEQIKGMDLVVLKDRPTEEIIAALRPGAYVKGKDWDDKLPAEQLAACALYEAQIVYLDTVRDSSTDRLRQWALRDADQSLDRLEAVLHAQVAHTPERFDTEYFLEPWRGDGMVYTLDTRREIEGPHPRILAETFPRMSMLDVGCGPGYLVQLLKELGVDAGGCDPSEAAVALAESRTVVHMDARNVPSRMADVVICREVLEHLTVDQITAMVADLFRIARKYVYITTRFSHMAVFDCQTSDDLDPTHISMLSQPFLRALCVLNGGKRRRDLEATLDHGGKGRVLCYEVSR
jgi:cytidyltransferase-like protein